MTPYRKKLIEVALPLEAINREAAREKSIRHGHPSTLHLWWARRPLAACRAVLFASLVDDPSSRPDKFPTEEAQEKERERLFRIIEELVKWENTNNETVLNAAREEILSSTDGNPPPVYDPFCGGGSIPLEAQRLGLKAYASDLNPVAVLITKALIEIPPKFAGLPPVNPGAQNTLTGNEGWKGAAGLAEDVRYYGKWMRDEAEKRIGHLYPKVKLPKEYGGGETTVIAWLWARTVKCPNPACGARMPLARSFWLSTKKGKKAWIEPLVDKKNKTVKFEVKTGEGEPPEGTVNRRGAACVVCKTPVTFHHVRTEGKSGRMKTQFMAIVAEGRNGRVYISPDKEHAIIAEKEKPKWIPDSELPEQALGFRVQLYGMKKHADLFTPRQLVALTTFCDLVSEAREKILSDAKKARMTDDGKGINDGGTGATAYADAVATYLAFAVDKGANYWSSLCAWHSGRDIVMSTFARQALPMVWDFTEANPFSSSSGNFMLGIEQAAQMVENVPAINESFCIQQDAAVNKADSRASLISTDPPYYDNIGYADVSDFFYIWLRRSLGKIYPALFSTVLVPKTQELVATPYRFNGDKQKARQFFEGGLTKAFSQMLKMQSPQYPTTIYYAFKQAETDEFEGNGDGANILAASTGWETMLEGLLSSGFSITGTWPMRTELITSLKKNVGALASSIVIVCRPRSENAPVTTRREFISALKTELPEALKTLQHENIAPVDFAQAAIGPGMAVFSRYSKVLEADGNAMSVRTALQLINQELDAYLAAQEGEMDLDTRFCLAWFEQHGMEEGPFGEADVLARAKNTSVEGLEDAGVLLARGGKVRLVKRSEYPEDYDPEKDDRLTIWECVQHLIRVLHAKGEEGAAALCAKLGSEKSEQARALAYRLYSLCDRKGWAEEALAYNTLVVSSPAIQEKITTVTRKEKQEVLFPEKARK